jgi:hypothetical protein
MKGWDLGWTRIGGLRLRMGGIDEEECLDGDGGEEC